MRDMILEMKHCIFNPSFSIRKDPLKLNGREKWRQGNPHCYRDLNITKNWELQAHYCAKYRRTGLPGQKAPVLIDVCLIEDNGVKSNYIFLLNRFLLDGTIVGAQFYTVRSSLLVLCLSHSQRDNRRLTECLSSNCTHDPAGEHAAPQYPRSASPAPVEHLRDGRWAAAERWFRALWHWYVPVQFLLVRLLRLRSLNRVSDSIFGRTLHCCPARRQRRWEVRARQYIRWGVRQHGQRMRVVWRYVDN